MLVCVCVRSLLACPQREFRRISTREACAERHVVTGRLLPIAFVTFRNSRSAQQALSPDGPTVRKLAEVWTQNSSRDV